MIYRATLRLSKDELDYYDLILDGGGDWQDEWYEDKVESYTVRFENGVEADLKVVGCGDESPYAEMVLFNDKGGEIGFSEPEYEFSGEWEAWDADDNQYIVNVVGV